jgi:hypothetical protein
MTDITNEFAAIAHQVRFDVFDEVATIPAAPRFEFLKATGAVARIFSNEFKNWDFERDLCDDTAREEIQAIGWLNDMTSAQRTEILSSGTVLNDMLNRTDFEPNADLIKGRIVEWIDAATPAERTKMLSRDYVVATMTCKEMEDDIMRWMKDCTLEQRIKILNAQSAEAALFLCDLPPVARDMLRPAGLLIS